MKLCKEWRFVPTNLLHGLHNVLGRCCVRNRTRGT